MRAFISHNSANKADARLLASAIVQRGASVWFDEWSVRPGESIAAGIESGLETSDVFILIWSAAAARSNWVGAELHAYLHRRCVDQTLRIVPVMIDTTRLPTLIADFRGYTVAAPEDFDRIAQHLCGDLSNAELAQLLQRRLWELAEGRVPSDSPHRYVVCPQCGSSTSLFSTATKSE